MAADVLSLVREVGKGSDFAPLQAALDAGAGADGAGGDGGSTTPLICAVESQNAPLVELLLAARADPNGAGAKGVRPLHAAAFEGGVPVLELLLAAGADANARDRHGQTPIFFAGDRQTCSILAKAGANPNILNKKGQTALHLACHAGLDEVVKWFTENASPGLLNIQDKHGRTAMYCASHANAEVVTKVLQASGANTKLKPHAHWRSKPANERTLPPKGEGALAQIVAQALQAKVAAAKADFGGTSAVALDVPASKSQQQRPAPVAVPKRSEQDTRAPSKSMDFFEEISPKRPDRHLMEQTPRGGDSEVLMVLEGSLKTNPSTGEEVSWQQQLEQVGEDEEQGRRLSLLAASPKSEAYDSQFPEQDEDGDEGRPAMNQLEAASPGSPAFAPCFTEVEYDDEGTPIPPSPHVSRLMRLEKEVSAQLGEEVGDEDGDAKSAPPPPPPAERLLQLEEEAEELAKSAAPPPPPPPDLASRENNEADEESTAKCAAQVPQSPAGTLQGNSTFPLSDVVPKNLGGTLGATTDFQFLEGGGTAPPTPPYYGDSQSSTPRRAFESTLQAALLGTATDEPEASVESGIPPRPSTNTSRMGGTVRFDDSVDEGTGTGSGTGYNFSATELLGSEYGRFGATSASMAHTVDFQDGLSETASVGGNFFATRDLASAGSTMRPFSQMGSIVEDDNLGSTWQMDQMIANISAQATNFAAQAATDVGESSVAGPEAEASRIVKPAEAPPADAKATEVVNLVQEPVADSKATREVEPSQAPAADAEATPVVEPAPAPAADAKATPVVEAAQAPAADAKAAPVVEAAQAPAADAKAMPSFADTWGEEDDSPVPAKPSFEVYRKMLDAIGEPVIKRQKDGCLCWDIELVKANPKQRYGFSHANDMACFARTRTDGFKNTAGPQALVVRRVAEDGLLAEWNAAHPDAAISPADRIVSVNGVDNLKAMQEQLKQPSVRLLVVRYPERFIVRLPRGAVAGEGGGNRSVGIQARPLVETNRKLRELKVSQISPDGLLEMWNQKQMAKGLFQFVVTQGMRIEALNEASGDSEDLAAALARATAHPEAGVLLRIRRAEMVRMAFEKCRMRATVWCKMKGTFRTRQRQSRTFASGERQASGSGRPSDAAAVTAPAVVGGGFRQSNGQKVPYPFEKEEQEDWVAAMETLAPENRRRRALHSSEEELEQGLQRVTIKDFCEEWEVFLDQTGTSKKYGFSFIDGDAQHRLVRGILGSQSERRPKELIVKSFKDDGLAVAWNTANPSLELLTCDRVRRVNDICEVKAMQQALKTSKKVTLSIVRYPQHFFVDLRRGLAGQEVTTPFGLEYTPHRATTKGTQDELQITEVSPGGLAERWNKRQIEAGLFQFVLSPGMRIQAVDGVEGSIFSLGKELAKGEAKRLKIRRADVANAAQQKLASKVKTMGFLWGKHPQKPADFRSTA